MIASAALTLDFFNAVFRDSRQPMQRRMRAAEIAAQYVHPTFKATAVIHADGDFATRLERAFPDRNRQLHQPSLAEEHPASELRPKATSANTFISRRRIAK